MWGVGDALRGRTRVRHALPSKRVRGRNATVRVVDAHHPARTHDARGMGYDRGRTPSFCCAAVVYRPWRGSVRGRGGRGRPAPLCYEQRRERERDRREDKRNRDIVRSGLRLGWSRDGRCDLSAPWQFEAAFEFLKASQDLREAPRVRYERRHQRGAARAAARAREGRPLPDVPVADERRPAEHVDRAVPRRLPTDV